MRGALRAALLLAPLLAGGCRTLPPPLPADALFREADRLLESYRESGAFPGGVLAVGTKDEVLHLHPFGRLSYEAGAAAVTPGTLYDLASLTKVVATTTMAMILVDKGRLDIDRPVRDFLPGFVGPGKDEVTVRHLLAHSSGLPAGGPLFEEIQGRKAYLERIQAMDLAYPPGSRSLYSDLGMILLGAVLEKVSGRPFEAFVNERVLAPLAMGETMFCPPASLRERAAPTEFDPWRGRLLRGEVHDENAYALGGAAPHAGLFGTAGDLARFARLFLGGGTLESGDGRRFISRATVELFTRRAGFPDSDRALGWDTKSAVGSSAGTLFSPRSFGHTGFTGTSLWIDPDRGIFVLLLTNRVHPTRDNPSIRDVRPAVADAVVRALDSAGVARGRHAAAAVGGAQRRGLPRRTGGAAHGRAVPLHLDLRHLLRPRGGTGAEEQEGAHGGEFPEILHGVYLLPSSPIIGIRRRGGEGASPLDRTKSRHIMPATALATTAEKGAR